MSSVQTIRVPFATRLTSLATNTTLGTATRHDFSAVTVYMPETTRTIRSVFVEISARDQFGTAQDFDGVRVGIKINAVAFDDVDYTIATANTGDHQTICWRRDVTSYFTTNDPATSSFTSQVGVAFATGAASNVTGVTAVLIITYEHNEPSSTRVKTICYPIQSHHTFVSTAYVEVGTVSGVSNAPASQIRKLTSSGMLPETNITIRHYWMDISGIDNGSAADLTLTVRVDGSTDNARFTCTQTLASNVSYVDRFDLTGLSTTAAHAFEVKSSAASTFEHIGAVVWVTYEYDYNSSRILNSLMMPLDNGSSTTQVYTDTTSTDAERWQVVLDIQEPGSITLDQTGVVFFSNNNNQTRSVLASGQTARAYSSSSNLARDTAEPIVHRCDHSSSTWTLARGKNRLTFDLYNSTEATNNLWVRGGYAIVNYTSDLSASGVSAHNHTTMWGVTTAVATSAARNTATPTAPNIPQSKFKIVGSYVDAMIHNNTANMHLGAERASGEGQGGGWQYSTIPNVGTVDSEVGSKRFMVPNTHWWRIINGNAFNDPERMNIETSRDWTLFSFTLAVAWVAVIHYVTYHANTFTVAGVVTVDENAVANGKTVEIWAKDSDNGAEYVDTDTTSGGTGSFSVEVLDNTRDYKATYEDGTDVGASLYGTPESESFDISMFTGGSTTLPLGSPVVRRYA